MSASLFSKTPTVTVRDNRGLTVRSIAYHRHPDTPGNTDERISHYQYDARGMLTQSADPRLRAVGLANFTYVTDLAGRVLRTVGVDAGTGVVLNDAADRPWMTVTGIRVDKSGKDDKSQALIRTFAYEADTLPGRPLSVTEKTADGASRTTARFVYAGNAPANKALNLAGTCVNHYDTAGLMQTDSLSLTGVPLSVTRRLLRDADNPDIVADWEGKESSVWNDLLAAGTFTTLTTIDATGAVLTTTDARGNQQRVAYDVAGRLSGSWVTVKGGTEQAVVRSLTYSAAGQKLREEHGNGVVTTYTYEPETQRLTGIKTERPTGHVAGAKILQDLHYEYDPVGNVLKVSNDAEETRFWSNQKVVPENTYTYDSLYQLVNATGREMASAGRQGSHLPPVTAPLPADASAYTAYRRAYTYDTGGNLTQMRHSAPATKNNYTTSMTVSDLSNRAVLSTQANNPSDVEGLFTAGGQQKQLLPGQDLAWTSHGELLKVSLVVREGAADDRESYRYDAACQRVLKLSIQKTKNGAVTQRTVYLPGLERRTTTQGSAEKESLQVIVVGEAGSAQVRVLHWENGKPDSISNDVLRWSYDAPTGSCGLELDCDGNVISREEYYPYGGTALLAARSEMEVNYKTRRYSGKERDATGLYYYGYRYYQPWAGRWLSADPAGTVDGLNLYRMVRNNPVTLWDTDGLAPTEVGKYKIDVGFTTRLKAKVARQKTKVAIFDGKKNEYVGTNEFKVVRLNDGDPEGFLFGTNELVNNVIEFNENYKNIHNTRGEKLSEAEKINISLGVDIAGYMNKSSMGLLMDERESAQSRLLSAPNVHPDYSASKEFFALMKKKDIHNIGNRNIYGLLEAQTYTYHKEGDKTDVIVNYALANPKLQVSPAATETVDSAFLIKGVGSFLTINAIMKLTKKYKVRSITTDAINVRSAAIAKKFGAVKIGDAVSS